MRFLSSTILYLFNRPPEQNALSPSISTNPRRLQGLGPNRMQTPFNSRKNVSGSQPLDSGSQHLDSGFLTSSPRHRRSNWMCHAGVFGLFRKMYESTGHTCEPNHIDNLKTTLNAFVATLRVSQSITHTINGKLVYIIKTTDALTTKVNRLSHDAQIMEATFTQWQNKLNRFAVGTKCHDALLFEFLSKHSNAVNNAFASFLRLTEIQDVLHQLSSLTHKALFGYTMLPRFLDTEIHAKLQSDQSLIYTDKAFSLSFSTPWLISSTTDST